VVAPGQRTGQRGGPLDKRRASAPVAVTEPCAKQPLALLDE
jgi:hypothetical protein